jgi:hypothetical protein
VSAIDTVFGIGTAGTEEQARRERPDHDRDGDRQQDAGGHEDERDRVDLRHAGMVGRSTRVEVGSKVTTTLGRRRFLGGAGLLLASACVPATAPMPSPSERPTLPELGADPRNGIWPAQYRRAPLEVREAYGWAVAHGPTLRFIPCYCGCGADGHTSNYSCYVRAELGGGRVVLDPHGFG